MSARHTQLSIEKSDEASLGKFDANYGEYSVNWRNIIFLPFNGLWDFFITCSVVINAFVVVYDIAYDTMKRSENFIDFTYYVLEVIYMFDTILTIAHRNMPHYRGIREYEPKNVIYLIIDITTLVPIYEVYLLVKAASRVKVAKSKARDILRLSSVFRLYRVYEYFSKMIYNAGINQVLVVSAGHYLKLILLTHIFGAVWYVIGCWKCKKLNWTVNLTHYKFNPHSPAQVLIICYTALGNIFTNNWKGSIRGENPFEKSILISAMIVGYVMHIMVYFGQLTRAYIKDFRRQFLFVDNLNSIKFIIEDLNLDKEWQEKTMEYYSVFWERRNGIRIMPPIFRLLPTPLQKEVTVDIFWEAMRHSHLYGIEDIPFKRALSLEMKCEFFLPGDFVYRLNKTKSKMVYIVSGILQVLTTEDEESPIISFSSGTVLGETACLLPSRSIANVRCATYCELQTLTIGALYRVLKNFSGKNKMLQARLMRRLQTAQDIEDYVRGQPKKPSADMGMASGIEDSSIRWIKYQWRMFCKLQRGHQKAETVETIADPCHCSDYLDLLVLSEEVELKMQVICLRGSCPFVLEPNSSFRRFTQYLALGAATIQSLLLPYNIAFNRQIPSTLFSICFVLDIIYFIDIYLQMSTAVKTCNVLISNSSKIITERMKEISFLVDILATLPIDYIAVAFGMNPHLCALLKLNRLLKLYRVIHHIVAQENSLWMNSLTARLGKYVFVYGFTGYWATCLMYALACFHKKCYEYSWFVFNRALDQQAGLPARPIGGPFATSAFYTLTTYLGIKFNFQYQYTAVDIWAHHILVMLGYYIFSFCFSGLCATFVLQQENQRNYRDFIFGMLDFLKMNKITSKLKFRIMNNVNFWWYYNQNAEVFSPDGILKDATSELKNKLVKQRVKECLEKVPLFSKCDDVLLNMVIEVATVKQIPSEALVVAADTRSSWMYVILRGYCKMKSKMAGDYERDVVTILRPGDAFPVIEVMHQVLTLVTVTTVTCAEIVSIKYSDLMDILLANPDLGKEITTSLKLHLATFEVSLLRKRGRLPEMIPEERSLGQGDMFTYTIYDDDEANPEETAYLRPFKLLGKWGFIRFFLLRSTIDPHKKFFICWEISRCCFAMVRVFGGLTYFNLLVEYRRQLFYVFRLLDVSCVLDMYVRLHCQYYNDKGITVTHPWATAKHYFNTSFAIDLFATMPFRQLQFDQLLGYHNKELVFTLLAVISRPWQLHRVIGFINYWQSNVQRKSSLLQAVKYTLFILVLINAMTVFIQILACTLESDKVYGHTAITCSKDSWISTSYFRNELRPLLIHVECLYVAIAIYTTSMYGSFTAHNATEAYVFIVLFIITSIVRWLILAIITSHRIGGNVNLTIYQERVKSFLDFVHEEYIDEELITDTIEHYQYIWRKTQGADITKTIKKFNMNLQEDVLYELYGPTLETVEIFQGADSGFFRQIGIHLKVRHFKKDSEIIRCNDVQGVLFVVYKGKVDITIAGTKMCTLGQGGIFGCLERQGLTRQTITAVAKVHVELLVINSNQFHTIVAKFPKIAERLRQVNFLRGEYAESKRRVYFGEESEGSHSKLASNTSAFASWFTRVSKKLNILIKQDDHWYKLWEYIVCVHLASISSLVLMFYIAMSPSYTPIRRYEKAIIYILDIIFLIKIYFGFHLTYADSESGIIIKDHRMVRMKYLKSFTFWLDILTCFPFEIITGFFTVNSQIIRYSLANRMFRFVFLVLYYNHCQDKLTVRTHLRWTYLLYWICINIQFMTSLWWFSACLDDHCYYLKSNDRRDFYNYVKADSGIDSVILAYTYIFSLFTTTGMRDVRPLTLTQILVTIVIVIVFQFTAIALSSEFATMLSIEQFTMGQYEYDIQQLRAYLQGRELSPPIVDKVWKYSLQLWKRQRGEWMPAIVTEAPGYLKQHLMTALYGHHLHNHFLFAHTHVDFLRQIIIHLQRCVFFPGNYLAEKGDMDGSMYFIHDGEVEVYDKHGNNDMLRVVLRRGQSFGEAQGLHNIAHDLSYKARTVVDALILKHDHWKYLLEWFPASNEEMFRKAMENKLKRVTMQESKNPRASQAPQKVASNFSEFDDDVNSLNSVP